MAAIVNYRDVLLQAAGTRVLPVALPSNNTVDFAQVNGTTRPSDNADVTVTSVNGGIVVTGGGITLSGGGAVKGGQTAFDTGNGFFVGWSVSEYKLSMKNASGQKITFSSAGLGIVGDISGASNLEITGKGVFNGNVTAATFNAAVHANVSSGGALGTATDGIAAHTNNASGAAVRAVAHVTGGVAVYGQGAVNSAAGVFIGAANGTGVQATNNSAGGTALFVDGPMVANNNALVANLNAELHGGHTVGELIVFNSVAAGAAPATTHVLTCTVGATSFRFGVTIP